MDGASGITSSRIASADASPSCTARYTSTSDGLLTQCRAGRHVDDSCRAEHRHLHPARTRVGVVGGGVRLLHRIVVGRIAVLALHVVADIRGGTRGRLRLDDRVGLHAAGAVRRDGLSRDNRASGAIGRRVWYGIAIDALVGAPRDGGLVTVRMFGIRDRYSYGIGRIRAACRLLGRAVALRSGCLWWGGQLRGGLDGSGRLRLAGV
ncbi:hypothetical protein ACPPVO_34850 [Dactylosporangium sp. McL0621]|uniref:hypothetical protein n=1 Tax=Dactylosporangium sp. McL0621 TaxID=3415678 RepID=UPI003CFAE731